MSIQKIAKLAGVSVATVSRVINNSDSVKEINRDKVLKAIEASNYQPNLLARQLRTARSSRVLVLVSIVVVGVAVEVEVVTERVGVVEEEVPVEMVVVGLVVGVMVCTQSGLGRQQRTRIL